MRHGAAPHHLGVSRSGDAALVVRQRILLAGAAALVAALRVVGRRRAEQPLRVRVLGGVEQLLRLGDLNQAPRPHDRDAVADVAYQADENELSLLCDRVLVLGDGEIRHELRENITPDTIVASIYTEGSRAKLRTRTTSVVVPDDTAPQ